MIFCSETSFFDDCGRLIHLKSVRKVSFSVVLSGIPLRKTTNSEIVSYKARVGMPKLLHIDCANS